jgi:predicted DNA-binding transcriptional regulator YafY
MRADRLLSILMILQTRGRMTAENLASELEVSQRTIYRDLIALSIAGVPVYSERGPGGGITLIEDYRTTLTGLTPDEARALFMMSIPAPLAQLGVARELKAAMLKLSASLPDSRRQEEERARQRIHLDSSSWFQSDESVPFLETVQQAVWKDRRLHIKSRVNINVEVEQEVCPYGLVAKANVWHLVYGCKETVRTIRVASIIDALMLPQVFTRPDEFNLVTFWENYCSEYELDRSSFLVKLRVSPDIQADLHLLFGAEAQEAATQAAAKDVFGWITIDLRFESFNTARTRLLGLGRAVEVLEPEPLRKSLLDYAQQIVSVYK